MLSEVELHLLDDGVRAVSGEGVVLNLQGVALTCTLAPSHQRTAHKPAQRLTDADGPTASALLGQRNHAARVDQVTVAPVISVRSAAKVAGRNHLHRNRQRRRARRAARQSA